MIKPEIVFVGMMLFPMVVLILTLIAFVIHDMMYRGELTFDAVWLTIGGIVFVAALIWLAVATKGETQMISGEPIPKYGYARNIESSDPPN